MKSLDVTIVSLLALLAIPVLPNAMAQAPGGWSKVAVKDKEVVAAAQFAVTAQQQSLEKAGTEEKLALEKILNAEQQVVQGMNYRLTLRVKVSDSIKTVQAEVWARVWLKPEEQYKLSSWKFTDEKEPKP